MGVGRYKYGVGEKTHVVYLNWRYQCELMIHTHTHLPILYFPVSWLSSLNGPRNDDALVIMNTALRCWFLNTATH